MKKTIVKRGLVLTIILLNFCQLTYAQFKAHGGLAFVGQPTFFATNHYALLGGGVILKGTSKPRDFDADIRFDSAYFDEPATTISRINFKTSKCDISYSNMTSIFCDAEAVVRSEHPSELYHKDVDLLGRVSSQDDTQKYPPEDYWYVELDKPLIKTKTGEQLLLVDLLQTDPEFYHSSKLVDLKKYLEVRDSLSKLSSFSYEYPYIPYNDYTYNDETTDYRFICSCDSNKLLLTGTPTFTFLYLTETNTVIVNDFTNYFGEHPEVIANLRKKTFSYAEDYARIAAFFRYMKYNYPYVWTQISNHYSKINKIHGLTPRYIHQ